MLHKNELILFYIHTHAHSLGYQMKEWKDFFVVIFISKWTMGKIHTAAVECIYFYVTHIYYNIIVAQRLPQQHWII